MIQYAYNSQIQPPAPFVHVSLRCAESGKEVQDLPAQLDTAADRTVVPAGVVDALALVPLDELPVGGFGGQVFLLPTFKVDLSIRGLSSQPVEVIGHPEESFILLGRDVLNAHRIVLDGPRLALEIE